MSIIVRWFRARPYCGVTLVGGVCNRELEWRAFSPRQRLSPRRTVAHEVNPAILFNLLDLPEVNLLEGSVVVNRTKGGWVVYQISDSTAFS